MTICNITELFLGNENILREIFIDRLQQLMHVRRLKYSTLPRNTNGDVYGGKYLYNI